jgi:hypothetical protein
MTTSVPVQSAASYNPMLAVATAGADTVPQDQKVAPPPRIPTHPNLDWKWGEQQPKDYTVYLPARQKDETGPIYSNLNPARKRQTGS